jgi:hypothetical protein
MTVIIWKKNSTKTYNIQIKKNSISSYYMEKKLIAIDIEWKQEIWREETLLTIHTKYLLDKQSTMI